MSKDQGTIQETYQLPSLGKLYGEGFPEEVTIRSMTTFEEKMRLGNQGFWKVMCNILNAVVTSPENFDAYQMSLFDFYFLMYKMRTVSYGNIYKVAVTCPHCGKRAEVEVDLDKLEVKYLPDDFVEPFEIGPLPRSGDMLQCKFLRVIDEINNEQRAKEILRKSPEYEGDPNYLLNISAQILDINNKHLLPAQVGLYVEKMPAMDSAYLFQAYKKITDGFGLDIECTDVCSHCGGDLVFDLPFNSEFFRPTFNF